MRDREAAGDEGIVLGIVLTFHPVGPDPIQIVLDGIRVEEAAGMQNETGAEELQGLLDLERLRESLQT
jgi:hypothetical protein